MHAVGRDCSHSLFSAEENGTGHTVMWVVLLTTQCYVMYFLEIFVRVNLKVSFVILTRAESSLRSGVFLYYNISRTI